MSKFESELPVELTNLAVKAAIPIHFLWGIQRCDEFCAKKTRKVAKAYQTKGTEFLKKNPVLAGLVPIENGSMIAIINGHHRVREAPNHHIYCVPSQILAVSLLSEYFEYPEEEFITDIKEWSSQALYDFDRKIRATGKSIQQPLVLPGIHSISDLEKYVDTNQEYGMLAISQLGIANS